MTSVQIKLIFRDIARAALPAALALGLTACPDTSTRKETGFQVSKVGIESCEKIELELVGFNIQLAGKNPTLDKKTALFPEQSYSQEQLERLITLLENYVKTSIRLLKLGDTRAVIFDQHDEIHVKSLRAQKFLGQAYVQIQNEAFTSQSLSTPGIDQAELEARLKHGQNIMKRLEKLNVKLAEDNIPQQVEKHSLQQLVEVRADLELLIIDWRRIVTLAKKNDGWGEQLYQHAIPGFQSMVTYFQNVYAYLGKLISEREKKVDRSRR